MRSPRTRYQQIAAAVGFEDKLNAKLIRVFRKYNKVHFTFKHNSNGKKWTTTLSKLENYGHNKFKSKETKKNTYWAPYEWNIAGMTSAHFDSFKVYIIECKGNGESFYKIGRTFNTIEKRFSSKDFPYEYRIVASTSSDAAHICKLETFLHTIHKEYQYKPKQNFSGSTECFTTITKETYAYFK